MNWRNLIIFRDVIDAWRSIVRRPLRSFLSSLGIGVGIAALLTMMSISEGAKQAALLKMNSLGAKTIRFENNFSAAERREAVNLSHGLQFHDRDLLTGWLGDRGRASAYVKSDNVLLMADASTSTVTVVGIDENWFAAENYPLLRGRPIVREDLLLQNKCAVIGARLAGELGLELLSIIRLNNTLFTVVGVGGKKGRLLTEGTGLSTLDFDSSIYVPVTALPEVDSGARSFDQIDGLVVAFDIEREEEIFTLADQIHQLLLREHASIEDFRMVVPFTLIEKTRENQRLFSIIMGAIASLSLLVGGIGVMNIMLANIAEQTREIGLRMAIGASRRRIIGLYLWNSVLLTFSGCCWGLLLGGGAVFFVSSYAGWDVAFSSFGLWLGPVSAVLTGLLFGLHPAMRAAAIDPAQALRET